MAKIFTKILKAGEKMVVPLGSAGEGDINSDFQISLRRLYSSEPDFRGERDINQSPILKIRSVHGDLNNVRYASVTFNSVSSKNKVLSGMQHGNSLPDIVPRELNNIIEEEFQIPELVAFDMASGISTIVCKDVYCSAVLIDDSENATNPGDIVVTVVA